MIRTFTLKPLLSAVETKTFQGKTNPEVTYIVKKTGKQYHVFAEVEAKEAALDCGAPKGGAANRGCLDPRDKSLAQLSREARFMASPVSSAQRDRLGRSAI
jgi:hypothetical protein